MMIKYKREKVIHPESDVCDVEHMVSVRHTPLTSLAIIEARSSLPSTLPQLKSSESNLMAINQN